ncbi:hypothetical protein DP42_4712 [Burkholderia pseudomallei]|nr:hypothetical protein DO73_4203 [Burkholderia pseudomallei]KGD22379.1 hypothetical protein DP42_4712 [Burkholderia pseudomallei]
MGVLNGEFDEEPPIEPPATGGCRWGFLVVVCNKKPRGAKPGGVFWSNVVNVWRVFGGGGGNRTRVQKRSTTSSTCLVLSFDLTVTSRTNTLRYGDSLDFRPVRRDAGQA